MGLFTKTSEKQEKQPVKRNEPFDTVRSGSVASGIWVDPTAGSRPRPEDWRFSLSAVVDHNSGKSSYYRTIPLRDFRSAILGLAETANWFVQHGYLPPSLRERLEVYAAALESVPEVVSERLHRQAKNGKESASD